MQFNRMRGKHICILYMYDDTYRDQDLTFLLLPDQT